jgi:hypothetical protein
METKIPKSIEVTLDTLAGHMRLTSKNEKALCDFAYHYALRRGSGKVGACRVTVCSITPEPDNREEDFGIPSARCMYLISHSSFMMAGSKEPDTVTVYRTRVSRPGAQTYEEWDWVYHFNIKIA